MQTSTEKSQKITQLVRTVKHNQTSQRWQSPEAEIACPPLRTTRHHSPQDKEEREPVEEMPQRRHLEDAPRHLRTNCFHIVNIVQQIEIFFKYS